MILYVYQFYDLHRLDLFHVFVYTAWVETWRCQAFISPTEYLSRREATFLDGSMWKATVPPGENCGPPGQPSDQRIEKLHKIKAERNSRYEYERACPPLALIMDLARGTFNEAQKCPQGPLVFVPAGTHGGHPSN